MLTRSTGPGTARTRLQVGVGRGLTRFVGRDAELEQLHRAQQLAGAAHGQMAAIVGEVGVGKSRLVYEFTHSHRLRGWRILQATSVSYGKTTSYLPVIDLLKGYFQIQDRDELREMREKVTGKVLALDDSLTPALPALLALLDVPVDDADWHTLGPGQRRQRTLDAVKRLMLREAREQPLLLIFEDLHWIDGETQAFLDSLVEGLGTTRMLLLVNYRPEYRHAWGSKTYYSQLRLDAPPGRSRRGVARHAPRPRCHLGAPQAAARQAWKPLLPGRDRANLGGDEDFGGRARALSLDPARPRHPGFPHCSRHAGGAHRPTGA